VIPSSLLPAGKSPFAAISSNGYWLVALKETERTRLAEGDYTYGIFRDNWVLHGWIGNVADDTQRCRLLFMDWVPGKYVAAVGEECEGELRVSVCRPDSLRLREVFRTDQVGSMVFHSWFDSALILVEDKGPIWMIDPLAGESALICELPVDRGFIHAVQASPDGRYLAAEVGDFKRRQSGLVIVDLLTKRSEQLTWERIAHRHRPVCWPARDTIRFLRRVPKDTGYQVFEARLDLSEPW